MIDNKKRCKWVNLNSKIYVDYHDNEWGIPIYDDKKLFELLVLEGFQAGLSWLTILKKRENFREAFDNFDVNKICEYSENKIMELMKNQDIIRNLSKIKATVTNAKLFVEIQKEYGEFSNYIWHFTQGKIIKNKNDLFQTKNELSDEISTDLKKRGMKFVGSTIVYSYLQAIGIINDHEKDCYLY